MFWGSDKIVNQRKVPKGTMIADSITPIEVVKEGKYEK